MIPFLIASSSLSAALRGPLADSAETEPTHAKIAGKTSCLRNLERSKRMKFKNRFKRPQMALGEQYIVNGKRSPFVVKCPACKSLIELLHEHTFEYERVCKKCGQRVCGLSTVTFMEGEDT